MADEKLDTGNVGDEAIDENTEFDQAFDEFAGTDGPEAAGGDEPSAGTAAKGEGEGEGEGEEEKPDTGAQGEPAPDPWAQAPEPLRREREQLLQQLQKLENDNRAMRGRVSAADRRLNELVHQAPGVSQQQVAAAMKDPEKWTQLREEYPDIAEAVESMIALHTQQIRAEMQQSVAPFAQAEQRRVVDEGVRSLKQLHPDVEDIMRSGRLQEWLGAQPPEIQQMASSYDIGRVNRVLTLFKLETGAAKPSGASGEQDPASPPQAPRADKRLERAVEVRGGRSPRSAAPAEDDFDAAFDYFASRANNQ